MSILDKRNWVKEENWYREGDQIAWFDKRIRLWTTYMIDDKGHQCSSAEYYANKATLKEAEANDEFRIEKWED